MLLRLKDSGAVMFGSTDDRPADPFGLDAVTPVRVTWGKVATVTRGDSPRISTVDGLDGTRHKATPYAYTIPTVYPCALFAAVRADELPSTMTVNAVKAWARKLPRHPAVKAATIDHDLNLSCECFTRGWRK